jgi:hypothetical protein
MPDTFVPESYGDKDWTKRRATDIAAAETIADPLTMPDHAFKVTKGSCGMEIKADFGSATDSANRTILRKMVRIQPLTDWHSCVECLLQQRCRWLRASYLISLLP